MNLRVRNGKYVSRCTYKQHTSEFATKYDNYSDDLPIDKYFKLLDDVITECLRVSKLTFFNIQMITGNKIPLLQILGKYAEYVKDIIIWDKLNGIPAMRDGVLNSQFEFIIIFDSEKPYNRMFDNANFNRGTLSNVWKIGRETNKDFSFKASFPEQLVRTILINFTKPHDTVLDPFMGSGTTGVVCAEMDRKFIGIELDSDTYKIAEERINKFINTPKTIKLF